MNAPEVMARIGRRGQLTAEGACCGRLVVYYLQADERGNVPWPRCSVCGKTPRVDPIGLRVRAFEGPEVKR